MSDQTGFDPRRRLCPDGTCTGVIGRDGRCGECGRTAGGGPRAGGGQGTSGATSDVTSDAASDGASDATSDAWPDSNGAGAQVGDSDGGAVTEAAPVGAAGSGFDPNRRLCDDGACVGVVGPNGACTVCGRVAG